MDHLDSYKPKLWSVVCTAIIATTSKKKVNLMAILVFLPTCANVPTRA